MSDPAGLVLCEIAAFHEAVAAWLGPTPSEADLARMARALRTDFVRIGPEGDMAGRDATLARLRAARGLHATTDPPFAVRIENAVVRWVEGERVLATYVESQRWAGRSTRRWALAAFVLEADAPGGVLWTELAETWITADAPSGPALERV